MTSERAPILILSDDVVVAALLGALVETFGHDVQFGRRHESADDAMRRVRPSACLLDANDAKMANDETLGHAVMRGVAPVLFGTYKALDRSRALVEKHGVDTLRMPPDSADLSATLERATRSAGPSVTL